MERKKMEKKLSIHWENFLFDHRRIFLYNEWMWWKWCWMLRHNISFFKFLPSCWWLFLRPFLFLFLIQQYRNERYCEGNSRFFSLYFARELIYNWQRRETSWRNWKNFDISIFVHFLWFCKTKNWIIQLIRKFSYQQSLKAMTSQKNSSILKQL